MDKTSFLQLSNFLDLVLMESAAQTLVGFERLTGKKAPKDVTELLAGSFQLLRKEYLFHNDFTRSRLPYLECKYQALQQTKLLVDLAYLRALGGEAVSSVNSLALSPAFSKKPTSLPN